MSNEISTEAEYADAGSIFCAYERNHPILRAYAHGFAAFLMALEALDPVD